MGAPPATGSRVTKTSLVPLWVASKALALGKSLE